MLYIEEFYEAEEEFEYYDEYCKRKFKNSDTDLGIDTEATEGDVGF